MKTRRRPVQIPAVGPVGRGPAEIRRDHHVALSGTFTVCCPGGEGRQRLPLKDSDACLIPPDAEMPVWGGFYGKHRDMVPSRGLASHNMVVTEMMINAGFVCLINM